jgi:hypothetical protein
VNTFKCVVFGSWSANKYFSPAGNFLLTVRTTLARQHVIAKIAIDVRDFVCLMLGNQLEGSISVPMATSGQIPIVAEFNSRMEIACRKRSLGFICEKL